MDIKEIDKEREKLEKAIFKLVSDFNDKTGILPDTVNLSTVRIEALGDKPDVYLLRKVCVDL